MKKKQWVKLGGYISSGPKAFSTDKGEPFVVFGIKFSQGKMRDGETWFPAKWYNCVAYGRPAQIMIEESASGDWVEVTGYHGCNEKGGKVYEVFKVMTLDVLEQTAPPDDGPTQKSDAPDRPTNNDMIYY